MAVSDIQNHIDRLEMLLPDASSIDEDSLYEIADAIDEVLDYEGTLGAYKDQADSLEPAQRELYDCLVHFECLWNLFNDLSNDGLLSVFYNSNEAEIEHIRTTLKAHGDPVSACFEKAYNAAAPTLVAPGKTNWVTRNPGGDPYQAIGAQGSDAITAVEDELEELRSNIWDRCVAMYVAVRNAI
jgi:hypothetical protein